jgi:hypothetical protein
MASRLELHDEFIDILESRTDTESRVYFQPPESLKMKYPCIRYSKSAPDIKRANNGIYQYTSKYEVIVIDSDPDSDISDKILKHFPMCRLERTYIADNLNHTVLTLYY